MTKAGKQLLAAAKEALEIAQADVTHTYDHLTDFCCYCGQSRQHVMLNRLHCFGDGHRKIVPISHHRRGAIMDAAERRVTYGSGNVFHDLGIPDPRDPPGAA